MKFDSRSVPLKMSDISDISAKVCRSLQYYRSGKANVLIFFFGQLFTLNIFALFNFKMMDLNTKLSRIWSFNNKMTINFIKYTNYIQHVK